MQAFHFGDSEHPLYGVIHEPDGGEYRNQAVLLCQPIGHEYFITHRPIKLLAEKLAALGYYVMRFDYAGVGESWGEHDAGNLQRWQADIASAAEELKSISGEELIVGVGVRMGATLLALSAREIPYYKLVLWEPIVSGEKYLAELKKMAGDILDHRWWFAETRKVEDINPNEFLGFDYSEKLQAELKGFELDALPACNTELFSEIELNFSNAPLDSRLALCKPLCEWSNLIEIDSSVTSSEFNKTIESALLQV